MCTFRNVFLNTAGIKLLYLTWYCSFWRATVLTELEAWLGVVYGFILHQTWPITVHFLFFKTTLNTILFLNSLESLLSQVCHQTDLNFRSSIIVIGKNGQTGKLLKPRDLHWETASGTRLFSSNQRKHTKERGYDIMTYKQVPEIDSEIIYDSR
jgi:hypothetical protein